VKVINCQKESPHKYFYQKDYDDLFRFISYYYQIELIREIQPRTILEIGLGNKFVSNYLSWHGYHIVTCDLEAELLPEVVGDIKNLPFKASSFEVVAAYEVLEHLPWEFLPQVLVELKRVTCKYVLLSVPYSGLSAEIILRFPLVWKLFKSLFIDLFIRVPYFYRKFKPGDEHYWELGWRGYSLKRFKKLIPQGMTIIKEVRPVLKTYHHFFVLKK